MKILIKVIFFLFAVKTFGQVTIKLQILDTQMKPIPYANIYTKSISIGSMSNEDGYFEIKIPKSNKELVVISALGYKSIEYNVNELERLEKIILEEEVFLLDEVIIKERLSVNEIITKAFENYDENFPQSPFYSLGFIRHSERTKKEYKWLVEGAIQVLDFGYSTQKNDIKCNISEIRQSFDNREIDTLEQYRNYLQFSKGFSFKKSRKSKVIIEEIDEKTIEKSIAFNDNRTGNPSYIFVKNINQIRNYNQKNAIFDKDILQKHNFSIDTIISYKNEEIFKIKITPKKPAAKLNRKLDDNLLPFGWIYIRSSDFAILEFEYLLVYKGNIKSLVDINGSKIRAKFKIKFTEIDGIMYPKFISFEKPKPYSNIRTKVKNLKANLNEGDDYYFLKQEILFTQIITDQNFIDKIVSEKKWNCDLFTKKSYNKEYWTTHSTLLRTKDEEQLILDLEKEVTLKEQFEKQ